MSQSQEPVRVPPQISSATGSLSIDASGSLHLRELTIRPSTLASPELRSYCAAIAAGDNSPSHPGNRIPSRIAPKSEWDEYDAWLDALFNRDRLAYILQQYPVDVVDTKIAGVRVGIVTPRGGVAHENERFVLINLHGGGFVYNRGLSFGQLESVPVASIGRIKVITLDYRQAPFHQYPAATEDVEAVFTELLKQHRPEEIGIFGSSAGGAITAQSLAWLQSKGLPRPGAVGIFNMAPPPPCSIPPWGTGWGDSEFWFLGVPRLPSSNAEKSFYEACQWYMEAADASDVKAYPGSSDDVLANFPPTLLLSGTRDIAMSSIVATHTRLLKLGVESSLYVIEGAPHSAHVLAVRTPEARDAQAHIARWFVRTLSENAPAQIR